MNKKEEVNAFVKECITMALIQLMETKDFENITIIELVKKAGVGRVSFYRNFESKEDILRKHLENLIKEWGLEFESSENPNFVESLFGHYYKHKKLFLLLYHQKLSYLILQNIKDVCGAKKEQENVPAYFSAWFSHGLYGWIDEWFNRGMYEIPAEMAFIMAEVNKNKRVT